MSMKTKNELKDVFAGLASMWFQKEKLDFTAQTLAIEPDLDVPVTVDTFSLNEGDPTINHYKVIGLTGDWVSTSTKGDIEVSFTVPTNHLDILKLAYGVDAVKSIAATVTTGSTGVAFAGNGVTLSNHKVDGVIVLVNEEDNKLLVLTNPALWAKVLYENGSTDPYAIQFTGTLESDGANPDIIFLTKSGS